MVDNIQIRMQRRDRIIARIRTYNERLAPDSPTVRAAFIRAATLIVSEAKINIRRQGLIDTGRLLNSLKYEFFKEPELQGIRIGSFGIPYAALHEFGLTVDVPGHKRLVTQAFGKQITPVLSSVKPHRRRYKEKPFLRPAFIRHRERVAEILSEALA